MRDWHEGVSDGDGCGGVSSQCIGDFVAAVTTAICRNVVSMIERSRFLKDWAGELRHHVSGVLPAARLPRAWPSRSSKSGRRDGEATSQITHQIGNAPPHVKKL